MDFSNFKTYRVTVGTPTMSITKNGITISKTSVSRMGQPSYVRLAINQVDKMFAIFVEEVKGPESYRFAKGNSGEAKHIRINNSDLLKTICDMMNWDQKTVSYKIDCTWHPEQKVLVADLKNAEQLPPRVTRDLLGQDDLYETSGDDGNDRF